MRRVSHHTMGFCLKEGVRLPESLGSVCIRAQCLKGFRTNKDVRIHLMRVSLWPIRITGSWKYLAGSWRKLLKIVF